MLNNLKVFDVVFFFLTLFASLCSGRLTYKGLLNVYPDTTLDMRLVFIFMIVIYVGAVTLFWILWKTYYSYPNRSFKDLFKLSSLSIIFIFFIFCTSTVFNIISLTGKIVVEREIQDKLNQIRIYIAKNTTGAHAELESVIKQLTSLSYQAHTHLEAEKRTGIGSMYDTYANIESKLNNIITTIGDQEKDIFSGIERKILGKITQFKDNFAIAEIYEAKRSLFGILIDSFQSNSQNLRDYVEKISLSEVKNNTPTISPTIVNSESLDLNVPNFLLDSNDQPSSSKNQPIPIETSGDIYSNALFTTKSKSETILQYIENEVIRLERGKLATLDSVETVQKAYRDLISDIQSEMLSKQVSARVDISSLEDILKYIKNKLNVLSKLEKHPNPEINRRRKDPYKIFLENIQSSVNTIINEVQEKQNENKNLELFIKEIENNFNKFQLAPIFLSMFMPKYFELPMISFAFFIDFIMALILCIMMIVKSVHTKN